LKRPTTAVGLLLVAVLLLAGFSSSPTSAAVANGQHPSVRCPPSDVPGGPTGCYLVPPGIHKIKHVIIVMQENRSFDSYFGTYPGADGIPMKKGVPTVCVPDPATKTCIAPFHDVYDVNGGGPHGEPDAVADVNKGKMNGFIASVQKASKTCTNTADPACAQKNTTSVPDVMGYHTAAEIPTYWP